MIAYIKGILAEKDPALVVIDVSGVGYALRISLQTYATLPDIGQSCKLFAFPVIREDSHTLFGFSDREERSLFEHLISVSGIGPATGMVFLSSLSSSEIIQAIVNEDLKTIQSIKGIGQKTSQRVIIELKDKLQKDKFMEAVIESGSSRNTNKIKAEALSALVTLGIPKSAAEKSINLILKRSGPDITLEEVIKLALR